MAQISMRVDDEVKRKAESACEQLGMNLTTAINIYLIKLGNEKRIPFEVAVDPFYSDENMARLRKSISQLQMGNSTEHDLIEVDE